jgi:thiol-disulfide isomerase/thioredoxin
MIEKKNLLALVVLAALAGVAGIYGFQPPESKIDPGPVAVGGGGLKPFATGALAALLVRSERLAPAGIAFKTGGGKDVKLEDWKGRVVLVNLWATWCGPCRKEMPALNELQKLLGSKDFEVVAISVDLKGAEASAAFLKETGVDSLALYVDPELTLLNLFQAPGLPVTILIDRQGREAARLVGPAEWASPEAVALIKAAMAE